jgi:hypothetical protein
VAAPVPPLATIQPSTGPWVFLKKKRSRPFHIKPKKHQNMKSITLPIAELKPALVGLGKVINSRATLPVLHHVKIERTSDGWIALTGTDLDRFVTLQERVRRQFLTKYGNSKVVTLHHRS